MEERKTNDIVDIETILRAEISEIDTYIDKYVSHPIIIVLTY